MEPRSVTVSDSGSGDPLKGGPSTPAEARKTARRAADVKSGPTTPGRGFYSGPPGSQRAGPRPAVPPKQPPSPSGQRPGHPPPSPAGDTASHLLRALHDVAVATSGVLDPESLSRLVVERARDLLEVDEAALYWYEPSPGVLRRLGDSSQPGLRIRWDPTKIYPPGDSVPGVVFERGEPLVLDDYLAWEGATPAAKSAGVHSVAAVPILANDRTVGSLVVWTRTSRSFVPGHVQLLVLFAAQVGPAIEAARLHAELERRRLTAEALAELARRAATHRDTGDVVSLVCEEAGQLTGADYSGVVLVEEDGTRKWTGMWGNRTDSWDIVGRPLGEGIVSRALSEKRTVVVERLGENPEFPLSKLPVHTREGGRTVITSPLFSRGQPLGALVLGWRSDVQVTQAEIDLVDSLAGQAATVLGMAQTRARGRRLTRELEARADELAASEARLRVLYDAVACGVLVHDSSGAITHANEAALEMIGRPFEEMRGQHSSLWKAWREDGSELAGPERPSTLALRTGNTVRGFPIGVAHPDGEIRWLQVDAVPVLGDDGQVAQVVTSFIDITARKLIEQQLLRAQRLETAGTVAAQVAHDFNNLLAPLVGFPELVKMSLPEGHPAVAYCDAMMQAALQMAEINEDLLALGRRGHLVHKPVDVASVIQQVLAQLDPTPPKLKVEVMVAAHLLPVQGVPAQLLRVLANLISNAREAMDDVGTLTVSAENVYVDRPLGRYARVEVGEYVRAQITDIGRGISPEIQDKIFDPFFTTRDSGVRRGSGLGLSVVQTIIEDHHGYVDLESQVGKGTTFSVYLPISREEPPSSTADTWVGGSGSILVVDDDPVQRDVAPRLLGSLGYQVEVASSGEEAVSYLADHPVDVVILDMVMPPGIDGAETYRRMLGVRPGQAAIVISGFADSERVQEALALGAKSFIRKPVTLNKLAAAVHEAIGQRTSR